MAKYITSIRDLMIQANNNISDIKTKAKDGDPKACFQMGMIHLLGIKTPVDFKKASSFLENPSLADDPDACRLLGFIGECEGNYSAAFKNFVQAAGSKSKLPYINKVYEERSNLQGFFKKLVLPNTVLNKEITAIINEYIKGDKTKVDACIKLASICDDETICLEVAQSLYDVEDYYSAKRWLNKGNITNTNDLFISIENKLSDSKESLKRPVLQVIDINGISLLDDSNTASSYSEVKQICNEIAATCKQSWIEDVSVLIEKIGKRLDEEEKERIKRQKEDKAARSKKQKSEENKAFLEALLEAEARRNKRKKQILLGAIALTVIFVILLGSTGSLSEGKGSVDKNASKDIVIPKDSNTNTKEVHNTQIKENINHETTYSEESLKKYLEEIIPKAIKMKDEEAVRIFFSREFINLYKRVGRYDEENVEDGCLGFWDFDFWTGGQDGELHDISVIKISEFSHNNAKVIIQYIIKYGEYDEYKSSCVFSMVFENGRWRIDDLNNYKFRFENYLNNAGQ